MLFCHASQNFTMFRRLPSFSIMRGQLRTPLKPLEHDASMVPRGLRGIAIDFSLCREAPASRMVVRLIVVQIFDFKFLKNWNFQFFSSLLSCNLAVNERHFNFEYSKSCGFFLSVILMKLLLCNVLSIKKVYKLYIFNASKCILN